MSLLSYIMNSRGRFKKKRRSAKNSTSPRKQAAGSRGENEGGKKRRKKDSGEDLLTMKRLREKRDSTPQGETEVAVPQALDSEVVQTMELQSPERLEQAVGTLDVATGTGETEDTERGDVEGFDDADKPCAVAEGETQGEEDGGMFGDLFDNLVEEEVSVTQALVASIPDLGADELVEEAAKVSGILRGTTSASN